MKNPATTAEMALCSLVKAVNNTSVSSRLVITIRINKAWPPLPINTVNLPEKRSRMVAVASAQSEMRKLTNHALVNDALRHYVLSAFDREVYKKDDVLMHHARPTPKWFGL